MAYIPLGTRWYVGEIVEEVQVEGADKKVVHRSLILIGAGSPDEAYEKAVRLGGERESLYLNPQGRKVTIRFAGISELLPIYDDLEDGAELMFSEEIVELHKDVRRAIIPKSELGVFRDARKLPETLDYGG